MLDEFFIDNDCNLLMRVPNQELSIGSQTNDSVSLKDESILFLAEIL